MQFLLLQAAPAPCMAALHACGAPVPTPQLTHPLLPIPVPHSRSYTKFLVDRDGVARKRFKPAFDPLEFEAGEGSSGEGGMQALGAQPCLGQPSLACRDAAVTGRLGASQHPLPCAWRAPRLQMCDCCWPARTRCPASASCTRGGWSARWTSEASAFAWVASSQSSASPHRGERTTPPPLFSRLDSPVL